ncbi:MAG: M48 family metallopeptidase [Steroidobacteraceae bacterium]
MSTSGSEPSPIVGVCFAAGRSRALPARLWLEAPGVVRLEVDGESAAASDACQPQRVPLVDVSVSERIGNVPRRFVFPDGTQFETADNDAVDAALDRFGRQAGFAHWLEQRWPIAVASLAAVVAIAVLFVQFGVPALADYAARTLPLEVDRRLGAETLTLLDRAVLKPTKLPATRQRQLQARFAQVVDDADDGHDYRLELRSSPRLGPNALALPSGIVVMTDELVELAMHDDELIAVLAHEVGHVQGRHALRQILQTAGVSAIAFAILGDVSSVSALATSIPVLLQAKHSRDFEREADAFAKRWLAEQGIAAHRFDDILCRMEAASGGGTDDALSRYLSTHPATDERARCQPPR